MHTVSGSSTLEWKWGQGQVGQRINCLLVCFFGKTIAASSKFITPIAIPWMPIGDCMKQTIIQTKFLGQVHHSNLPRKLLQQPNIKQNISSNFKPNRNPRKLFSMIHNKGKQHWNIKQNISWRTQISNLTEIAAQSLSQKPIKSEPERCIEPPSLPLRVSKWP